MTMRNIHRGILFIGDPHLSSRTPGYRKDDYPRVILGKLRWCIEYACAENLIPVILGDLFHWPRDNANWLLTALLQIFTGKEVLAIAGNHDTTERELIEDDSLSVIVAAGGVRLIDQSNPWRGEINGVPIVIGGTCWSQSLPDACESESPEALVIWLAHHNICFWDVGEPWQRPRELKGIDLLVNGHLHRPHENIVCGQTTWINPGNIARVLRADAVREARPSALRVDIRSKREWETQQVEVPHEPFEKVFHDLGPTPVSAIEGSTFIAGLESLRTLRTASGAGLMDYLNKNLARFEPAVSAEILSLAKEVCPDGQEHETGN